MVIAETVNRKGRLLVEGGWMVVQVKGESPRKDLPWHAIWGSECLDDDDVVDGVEFMEGYCWCEPKLAFGPCS